MVTPGGLAFCFFVGEGCALESSAARGRFGTGDGTARGGEDRMVHSKVGQVR